MLKYLWGVWLIILAFIRGEFGAGCFVRTKVFVCQLNHWIS